MYGAVSHVHCTYIHVHVLRALLSSHMLYQEVFMLFCVVNSLHNLFLWSMDTHFYGLGHYLCQLGHGVHKALLHLWLPLYVQVFGQQIIHVPLCEREPANATDRYVCRSPSSCSTDWCLKLL